MCRSALIPAAVSIVAVLDKARCYLVAYFFVLTYHVITRRAPEPQLLMCLSSLTPLPQRITSAGIGKKGHREDQHYETMKGV